MSQGATAERIDGGWGRERRAGGGGGEDALTDAHRRAWMHAAAARA
jgi:hypothetical protein